jgi:hypothetical protein
MPGDTGEPGQHALRTRPGWSAARQSSSNFVLDQRQRHRAPLFRLSPEARISSVVPGDAASIISPMIDRPLTRCRRSWRPGRPRHLKRSASLDETRRRAGVQTSALVDDRHGPPDRGRCRISGSASRRAHKSAPRQQTRRDGDVFAAGLLRAGDRRAERFRTGAGEASLISIGRLTPAITSTLADP